MTLTRALGAAAAVAVTLTGALVSPAQTATAAPAASSDRAAAGAVIKVASTTVAAAGKVTITGRLATKLKRTVVLQQRTKGTWTTAVTKRSAKSGRFTVKVAMPAKPGKVRLRAVAPAVSVAGRRYRAALSKTLVLKVVADDDPAVPGGPGSVEDPYAVGEAFSVGSWGFAFGETDTDHWPEIQASGSTATEAPEPGWSYLTVPVTFTNRTGASKTPYYETYVEFLGNDGETYDDSSDDQWCGQIPGSFIEIGSLGPGQSATGLACVVVPTAAISRGMWLAIADGADDEELVAYVQLQ